MKLKAYKFDKVLSNCLVSRKIDGVRAIRSEGKWLSRAGKPLYNLPMALDGHYEAFINNWEDTVSAVRTIKGSPINSRHLYRLDVLDERLEPVWYESLKPDTIKDFLQGAVDKGDEGICILSDQGHFKVKPVHTYDVEVIGAIDGKGRHIGRVGALITDMGNVGTGLTDKDREEFQRDWKGIIEVACMGLTPSGKFRHPRFIRRRLDK